jgi:hypothetical protein
MKHRMYGADCACIVCGIRRATWLWIGAPMCDLCVKRKEGKSNASA